MNIEERIDGIDFEAMPRTFQDAVTVTRNLGLRYIWIDSLCIIQDDRSDWLTQSLKMGTIYRNAKITIAATGAADGSVGCFPEHQRLPLSNSLTTMATLPRRSTYTLHFVLIMPVVAWVRASLTKERGSRKNGFYLRERYISPENSLYGYVGRQWRPKPVKS